MEKLMEMDFTPELSDNELEKLKWTKCHLPVTSVAITYDFWMNGYDYIGETKGEDYILQKDGQLYIACYEQIAPVILKDRQLYAGEGNSPLFADIGEKKYKPEEYHDEVKAAYSKNGELIFLFDSGDDRIRRYFTTNNCKIVQTEYRRISYILADGNEELARMAAEKYQYRFDPKPLEKQKF